MWVFYFLLFCIIKLEDGYRYISASPLFCPPSCRHFESISPSIHPDCHCWQQHSPLMYKDKENSKMSLGDLLKMTCKQKRSPYLQVFTGLANPFILVLDLREATWKRQALEVKLRLLSSSYTWSLHPLCGKWPFCGVEKGKREGGV